MQGDEIAILRKQRLQAIANCDFSKARAIDLQMQKLNEAIMNSNYNQILLENKMEFEKLVESLKLRAAEQFTIAYQRINDVHVNFQKRKVVLLQNQSDQMTEIANEYSRDLETSALRQIPESEILKKQAQIQAKFGNYDSAEYLFAISNDKRESTLLQRQEEIHSFYGKLQDYVSRRHQDELALNDEKKFQAIQKIKIEYDNEVERMKKVLHNSSIKYQIELDPFDEETMFQELNINEDENNELPQSPSSPKSISPNHNPQYSVKSPTPPKSKSPKTPIFKSPRTPGLSPKKQGNTINGARSPKTPLRRNNFAVPSPSKSAKKKNE